MRTFLMIILLTAVYGSVSAQVGVQFPDIKGLNLLDSTIRFPKDVAGKYSLVGMAYSEKAQADLDGWLGPIEDNFFWGEGEDDDVHLYFIAVLNTLSAVNLGKVKSQAKEYLLPEYYPLAVFTTQNMQKAEGVLKISDQSKPYFFVLDPAGKVVYATSGAYTQAKIDRMVEIIDAGTPDE